MGSRPMQVVIYYFTKNSSLNQFFNLKEEWHSLSYNSQIKVAQSSNFGSPCVMSSTGVWLVADPQCKLKDGGLLN